MKPVCRLAFIAAVIAAPSWALAGQSGRGSAAPAAQAQDPVADAYAQFLLAHRLEDDNDIDGAVAAYKRAMALDPKAADIVSELADLYMRQNRAQEAQATAEQALKISPANHEAHRVLGTVYASMASQGQGRGAAPQQRDNMNKAIQHLEQAIEGPMGRADANLRAMLARLYVRTQAYDKAIPVLAELVKQEPQWQDGASLLVEAYASAGRSAEAVKWLEEQVKDDPELLPTLGDFYQREGRWRDAAGAYKQAVEAAPRSFDLQVRYAQALLFAGSKDEANAARDTLRAALNLRANDERALWLLSQAERRSGDLEAAEATARRLVTQNPKSARGYSVLAEALEERRRYQTVVDALAPAMSTFRSGQDPTSTLGLLLPHLGFAYQQVGQYDKAVSTFEEARKLAPDDPAILGYLIQANLGAKNYSVAADLARQARTKQPDNLGLARLEAQALRQSGKTDQGIAVLEAHLQKHADDPDAYVAMALQYSDSNRGAQALKTILDAQTRFPDEAGLAFEHAAILEKQKKYTEAETVFRQLIAKDPRHAAALNYLGYMLADRGERLDESVSFIKRALVLEPENGSFLDSLGWAYFKSGKLDLAEENLKRAADQLVTNSVIQDHYGDVLAKMGRYDQAIAAWNRALSGDGDSIDRSEVDKKIRSAKQRLPKR